MRTVAWNSCPKDCFNKLSRLYNPMKFSERFESLVIEFSQLIRSQKPPFEQFSTAERAGPRLLNCARVAMSLTPFRRSTPARAGFGLGAKAHGPPKCRPAYSHGPLAPRFPRIAFQIRRIKLPFSLCSCSSTHCSTRARLFFARARAFFTGTP